MAKNKKTKRSLEGEFLDPSSEDEPTADFDEVSPMAAEDPVQFVEPVEPPSSTPVPENKPLVKLAVFLKVAGPKWDQLAGFKHFAQKQGLGPLTIPEWREELQKFLSKPTG